MSSISPIWSMIYAFVLFLLCSITLYQFRPAGNAACWPAYQECGQVARRREWRTLSRTEKLDYINAVKCLQGQPSSRLRDASLYDEFSWIHSQYGEASHDAASFLPWHRWFIHHYEETLRQECSFRGNMPYWDWSVDATNLSVSPIFDVVDGFGANGEIYESTTSPLLGAACVASGPFADLQSVFHVNRTSPHCLSRWFATGQELDRVQGMLKPEALASIMANEDYVSFLKVFEETAHSAIPFFIGGDFKVLTAPNDPIFFLHHAQVDRIWWLWQKANLVDRGQAYDGIQMRRSRQQASIADQLYYGDFWPSIRVGDVMATTNGLLCYDYGD